MKTNLIKTAVVSAVMKNKVYKVLTESEWKAFQKTGQFKGSKDDIRDGFIHLSTKEQVAGVIERFFLGKHPLYVAEFSSPDFLKCLKWEASSSNEVYPHLYSSELFVNELSNINRLE
jgi:uncharacterized protein (DUF952 family)